MHGQHGLILPLMAYTLTIKRGPALEVAENGEDGESDEKVRDSQVTKEPIVHW